MISATAAAISLKLFRAFFVNVEHKKDSKEHSAPTADGYRLEKCKNEAKAAAPTGTITACSRPAGGSKASGGAGTVASIKPAGVHGILGRFLWGILPK